MKKRLLSLALALCLVCSLLPGTALAAGENPFTDVPASHWAHDDITYVYENDLMNGTDGSLFSPESTTTRAQVVTVLYRLAGQPAADWENPFWDVPASAWFHDAVTWAWENDITGGVSSTHFGAGNAVTREQLAAFLYRYAGAQGWDTSARVNLNQFQDQRLISSYARTALSWACGEGLLTGSLENGKVYLSPTVIAPRNQLAAVLHRFCQQVAPTPPPATGDIFVVAPDAEAIFDQMPKDFVFTSGAGGWATQLTIHPDGIFDGTYYDSNLGDTGPGYPNGTVYYCVFKGSWKDVTQTNPWEYRMYLESLSYTAPSGVTTIQNGTRYIAAEVPPYGLNNPKEFRLYLPGRPTGDLPGAYLDWARIASGWTTLPSVLPTWGLYNVGGQQGYVEDLW